MQTDSRLKVGSRWRAAAPALPTGTEGSDHRGGPIPSASDHWSTGPKRLPNFLPIEERLRLQGNPDADPIGQRPGRFWTLAAIDIRVLATVSRNHFWATARPGVRHRASNDLAASILYQYGFAICRSGRSTSFRSCRSSGPPRPEQTTFCGDIYRRRRWPINNGTLRASKSHGRCKNASAKRHVNSIDCSTAETRFFRVDDLGLEQPSVITVLTLTS